MISKQESTFGKKSSWTLIKVKIFHIDIWLKANYCMSTWPDNIPLPVWHDIFMWTVMHGLLNALNNSNVSKRKLQEMDHSNANDHGHPVGIHSTLT